MAIYDEELQFTRLLSETGASSERAPASLKSRLYSALVHKQQAQGPLASLNDSAAAGYGICVFEKLVQIAPVGEKAKSQFFCEVCHARVLAESFDHPPIYWHNCPYVDFKN